MFHDFMIKSRFPIVKLLFNYTSIELGRGGPYNAPVSVYRPIAEEDAKVFAALSDPMRLRFIRTLVGGEELSGTEISERLGISLALVCHHSRILSEARVVVKRKRGQTAFYKLDRRTLTGVMRKLLG